MTSLHGNNQRRNHIYAGKNLYSVEGNMKYNFVCVEMKRNIQLLSENDEVRKHCFTERNILYWKTMFYQIPNCDCKIILHRYVNEDISLGAWFIRPIGVPTQQI